MNLIALSIGIICILVSIVELKLGVAGPAPLVYKKESPGGFWLTLIIWWIGSGVIIFIPSWV
jgi:hypothetical protein